MRLGASRRVASRGVPCLVLSILAGALVMGAILFWLLFFNGSGGSAEMSQRATGPNAMTSSAQGDTEPVAEADDGPRRWAMRQLGLPGEPINRALMATHMQSLHSLIASQDSTHREDALTPGLTVAEKACELVHFNAPYRHKESAENETLNVEYVRIFQNNNGASGAATPPPPTLVLFHGCGHAATDFCAPSRRCPKCIGLMEEVKFVAVAVTLGFDVLAVSSMGRPSRCWANSRAVRPDPRWMWNNRDVFAVLQVLAREGRLATATPLVAMGASSGGSVLAVLPQVLGGQLFAAVPQIAAPHFDVDVSPPVVLYDVMSKDKPLLARASSEHKKLAAATRSRVRSALKLFSPPPISDDVFARRVPGFPSSLSRLLVRALSDESVGLVAGEGRSLSLRVDPRTSRKRWVPALTRALKEYRATEEHGNGTSRFATDSLEPGHSVVEEELNVLWGVHEFFADHAETLLRSVVDFSFSS